MLSGVPRLRFAPAPTGLPHLGTARTALFNWLYARHCGGEMVLRIEDTNAELATTAHIDQILETLDWLGLDFDGDPVFQSHRGALYDAAVDRWLDEGRAYVDDGAVRFAVPDEGVTAFDDIVRGRVEFPNASIDDFVVRRSDGSATFFVANAVDDLDLGITHVVRGEDLLNTTPKVVLLRAALGAPDMPTFAHLPLIVNKQRKKLSKRRDDVSLISYRDQGVLPAAMVNYLALLGWGPPDDIEVRALSEIVDLFDLADVNAAPAMFDIDKLTAINGSYVRALDDAGFAAAVEPWVRAEPWGADLDAATLSKVAPLIRERTRLLGDAPGRIAFLFAEPQIDPDDWAAAMVAPASDILDRARTAFSEADWSAVTLHAELRAIGESFGLKLGKAQAPVRVATTGRAVGPPLFESLALLGRENTLARLDIALAKLASAADSGE
ncbi:MAG: glutamate--tRNA ligase [Acidimicrobiales bacterium]|nr:glutamate--tRNA ligase family protein [Acidimicrobiaceae bacterium]MXV86340.1 glutamate--tRNA ligase [Acidimicrobiales bacterium]MYB82635.1 glutamate--tRNA ligase [Acidimicrobiales bacterium]MYI13234.1 glutamate--tRNA ligase [Acidimicrobiales bacterium]